ncbi:MAG: CvpA family protein [Acutalibacteraceae bacterium]|nr:CvpA family protein [Acutalibacteraceae bacterium]
MNTFDLVMLIITLIFIVIGYARGAIKTILSVVGGIFSYILAVNLGEKLAKPIYDIFFRKSIGEEISTNVGKLLEKNNGDIGDSVLQTLPDSLQRFVSDTNIIESLNDVVGETTEQVVASATGIIQQVVEPLVVGLIYIAVVFILFILFNTIVNSVLFLADFVNKIPVIGKANRITGAMISLVAGLVLTYGTVSVCSQILPYVASDSEFSNEINSNSVFFEIFADEKNDSEIFEKNLATQPATEGEYVY